MKQTTELLGDRFLGETSAMANQSQQDRYRGFSCLASQVFITWIVVGFAFGAAAQAQGVDVPMTAKYDAAQIGLVVDNIRQRIQEGRPQDIEALLAREFVSDPRPGDTGVISGERVGQVLRDLAEQAMGRSRRVLLPPDQADRIDDITPFADFVLRQAGPVVGVRGQRGVLLLDFTAGFVWDSTLRDRQIRLLLAERDGSWVVIKAVGLIQFLEEANQRFKSIGNTR